MEKYDDYKIPTNDSFEKLKNAYSSQKVDILQANGVEKQSGTTPNQDNNRATAPISQPITAPTPSPNSGATPIAEPSTIKSPASLNFLLLYAMLSLIYGGNSSGGCGRNRYY